MDHRRKSITSVDGQIGIKKFLASNAAVNIQLCALQKRFKGELNDFRTVFVMMKMSLFPVTEGQ